MNPTEKKCAVHIIARVGFADEIVKLARTAGAGGATIINARGEGGRPELFLGMTIDSEKEIILCLTDTTTAKKVMQVIKDKMGITTPAHCVSYTTPIEDIVGIDLNV